MLSPMKTVHVSSLRFLDLVEESNPAERVPSDVQRSNPWIHEPRGDVRQNSSNPEAA